MDTEFEQGSVARSSRPRHNGYYAGDFRDRPFPTEEQFHQLMSLSVPPRVGPRHGVPRLASPESQ